MRVVKSLLSVSFLSASAATGWFLLPNYRTAISLLCISLSTLLILRTAYLGRYGLRYDDLSFTLHSPGLPDRTVRWAQVVRTQVLSPRVPPVRLLLPSKERVPLLNSSSVPVGYHLT